MKLEILNPGVRSLIQDAGRFGLARYGVPRSGAFDRGAWRHANRLVGNHTPDEYESNLGPAAIEVLFGGLRVQAHGELVIAVTGALAPLTVLDVDSDDKREVVPNDAFVLTAGSRLHVGTTRIGLRSYLAVAGALNPEETLGSRSSDTTSGLGPPPLAKGQVIDIGTASWGSTPSQLAPPEPPAHRSVTIHVRPGPHADLVEGGIDALVGAVDWTVNPTSGRSGVRLTSKDLNARVRTTRADLPSEPTLCGAVQALPSGELVVIGPDGPTTGGYPVVAVIDQPGIDQLAQARPGAIVHLFT